MKRQRVNGLPKGWDVVSDDTVLLGVISHECDDMSSCFGCHQECPVCGAKVPVEVEAYSDFLVNREQAQ